MQELIESNWCIMTKSGSVELEWNIVPDSIPEYSLKKSESLGIRSMDWMQFQELRNMAKSGKKKDRMPQPFFDLFLLLWPGDWKNQLSQLNEAMQKTMQPSQKIKCVFVILNPYQKANSSLFLASLSHLVP